MIKSFRHKGLAQLHNENNPSGVRRDLVKRCLRRLAVLHNADSLEDLAIPGFNFHVLHGKPKRCSIHVSGPWCITFEWLDGVAWRVDLEQYH